MWPPLPFEPWPVDTPAATGTPEPSSADAPAFPAESFGPRLPGSPWFVIGLVPPVHSVPVPPTSGAGSGVVSAVLKPFIPRVPETGNRQRLARFTEAVAIVINSLFASGQLVQLDPDRFEIVVGGSSGNGLTGTFP